MTDPADESQIMPAVKEEFVIPSDAEQRAAIRRLWLTCIGAAAGVFAITGGIVLTLFLKGYDSKKVVEISTAIFQVLMLSYGMGFFVPALITSLRTMMLGVRMSRKGLEIGEQTAQTIMKVDEAIEGRIKRFDELLAKVEAAWKKAEGPEIPFKPQLLAEIEKLKTFAQGELKALRDDIRGAKADADAELGKALDEGEIEAQAPRCDLCGKKMISISLNGKPSGNYSCTCVPIS
jgi:hypothetical protein